MRHLPAISIYGYVGGRQIFFGSADRYWRDQLISVKIIFLAFVQNCGSYSFDAR